jgi:predicted CoA-binding protein
MEKHTVAILGASKKPDRYSYKAFKLLREHGYDPIPIHPVLENLEGAQVMKSILDIPDPVDTLTLYVGPGRITALIPEILQAKPRRVILNPGTESQELMDALDGAGIKYVEACTLVLLKTDQFLKV